MRKFYRAKKIEDCGELRTNQELKEICQKTNINGVINV